MEMVWNRRTGQFPTDGSLQFYFQEDDRCVFMQLCIEHWKAPSAYASQYASKSLFISEYVRELGDGVTEKSYPSLEKKCTRWANQVRPIRRCLWNTILSFTLKPRM